MTIDLAQVGRINHPKARSNRPDIIPPRGLWPVEVNND
jgi:hypothetical protein